VRLETAKFSEVMLLPIDEVGLVGTRLRMKVVCNCCVMDMRELRA